MKSEPCLDHRLVVEALAKIGLRSAYHTYGMLPPEWGSSQPFWSGRYGPFHPLYVLRATEPTVDTTRDDEDRPP